MPEGLVSSTAIRVFDPGYVDREAEIFLPRAILNQMGIAEGVPINIQVRDDAPDQILILGPDTSEDLTDHYSVLGFPQLDPDPNDAPRYSFRLPREWKEEHWRLPWEDRDDQEENLYRMIEEDYNLEAAQAFLPADGTLIIPLGR